MDNGTLITIIISVAALFVAILTLIVTIATLRFTVKNSKGYLHKEIDRKTAHLQSSVFKLSKDLIDSIHEEGIVAYTS